MAALLPIAESVANGSAVDWDAAEAGAVGEERGIVRQLRVLSRLAALHQSLPADPVGASYSIAGQRSSPAPAIGNWEHLELIERLGGGAFADVYRAWDRHLEREVALKLLRASEMGIDPQKSRIVAEGRLLARVRHPNVVTVHGVAVHDGRFGLWMELVRGATLEEVLRKQGPFSAREAALVGIDLCRALAAIHKAGLIHRDVKAQNVMREEGGRIVLMDLGTSREVESPRRTVPSDLAGTPLYLAPELFNGTAASEATDLYSLGVLLYHLVTGSFPVPAKTIEELEAAHRDERGVRLRDARADLPTAFVRVVDRMIARDPACRYATAGALEGDMAALDDRAVASTSVHSGAETRAITRSGWRPFALVAAVVIAALTVSLSFARTRFMLHRAPLSSRDIILVADFVNRTTESVFDGALKEALTIELQQSPYLNVLGATGVQAELRSIAHPAGPLEDRMARDLCDRQHAKALILGSIDAVGNHYLVSVQAQNCRDGGLLAKGEGKATSRSNVLAALGIATATLRENLGESRSSIQGFNVPVEDATTGSLEALKAYSVGMDTRARVGEAEAIPFFNHALELDPGFALAEGRLGAIYANLHELDQSDVHIKKAFELSTHVTERERLYIRGSYHLKVTGRFDEAIGAYRLWATLYPQDWLPPNNIAGIFARLGQFDDALKEAHIAQALGPYQVIPYTVLTDTYMLMGRFSEARATLELARARGLDTPRTRSLFLQLALVERGPAAMREEFDSLASGARDYVVAATAARSEAFAGNFPAARILIAQAVAKAQAGQMNEFAASLLAEDALNAALASQPDYAREALDRALTIAQGTETLWMGSLAAAFLGRLSIADRLREAYVQASPATTDVVAVYGPVLRAAGLVAAKEYRRAIEVLQPALAYERLGRFWPQYIRGLAYLELGEVHEAAHQFETILADRGNDPTSILFPLASLQLGRTLRSARDGPGARAAFDAFITAWDAGGRNQPLLAAAIRERARLPR